MPLYDFRCRGCDARFEARTPAGVLPACERCGSPETERVLSGFAGPFTVAPKGLAARRSNALRHDREARQLERREERRRQREEHGPPPPKPPRSAPPA